MTLGSELLDPGSALFIAPAAELGNSSTDTPQRKENGMKIKSGLRTRYPLHIDPHG